MRVIQVGTQNTSFVTGATSAQAVSDDRGGQLVRSSFVITNTSAAAVITVNKGDVAAVQGEGIRLNPSEKYGESTDSGFECWQGAVQIISDVAGTIGLSVSQGYYTE